MAQDYIIIQNTDTLANSLPILNENLTCLVSSFSGTSFPTTNIVIGMQCFRTDQGKLYRLLSTGPAVWVLVENLAQTYLSQQLADARYFQVGVPTMGPLRLQGVASGGNDSVGIAFHDNPGVGRMVIAKDPSQSLVVSRFNNVGGFLDNPLTISNADGTLKHGASLLWDAGNDGSGSGLDADLVRGTTPGTGGLAVLSGADTAAVLTALGITNGVAQTGQIGIFYSKATIPGYVHMNGKTVGPTGSTATERANDDTLSLYNLLWAAGNAVTGGRGASAAADWAAAKPIATPDARGRVLVCVDDNGNVSAGVRVTGSPTLIGYMLGEELHQLISAELPTHVHGVFAADPTHTHGVGGAGPTVVYGSSGVGGIGGGGAFGITNTFTITNSSTGIFVHDGSGVGGINKTAPVGSNSAHNNMPPYLNVGLYIHL